MFKHASVLFFTNLGWGPRADGRKKPDPQSSVRILRRSLADLSSAFLLQDFHPPDSVTSLTALQGDPSSFLTGAFAQTIPFAS